MGPAGMLNRQDMTQVQEASLKRRAKERQLRKPEDGSALRLQAGPVWQTEDIHTLHQGLQQAAQLRDRNICFSFSPNAERKLFKMSPIFPLRRLLFLRE